MLLIELFVMQDLGPAPLKTNSNNIPFVTTYYDNVNNDKKF